MKRGSATKKDVQHWERLDKGWVWAVHTRLCRGRADVPDYLSDVVLAWVSGGRTIGTDKWGYWFWRWTVRISETYYRRNQTNYITPSKTESSNRKITIPKFLQEKLKNFLDR